jgi:class 3 adenylate cyclase
MSQNRNTAFSLTRLFDTRIAQTTLNNTGGRTRRYLQHLSHIVRHGAPVASWKMLIPAMVIIAISHPFFYAILSSLGLREHLGLRLGVTALCLVVVSTYRFRMSHPRRYRLVYETVLACIFPVFFSCLFVVNGFSTYWYGSIIFAALIYGLLSSLPILAPLLWIILQGGVVYRFAPADWMHTALRPVVISAVSLSLFSAAIGSMCKIMVEILYNLLQEEQSKTDALLYNVLPKPVANDLKQKGRVVPRPWEQVSVLFTDFVGFTAIAQQLEVTDLIEQLDEWFCIFDDICAGHGLEKIKTIGDSYMASAGIPQGNRADAVDAVCAALQMQAYARSRIAVDTGRQRPLWQLRIGIHSGPLIAGVLGNSRFIYDVFGDSVNVASRLESACEPGRVNISRETLELINPYFECEGRGMVEAKGKGLMDMFFVNRIKEEYANDREGVTPGAEMMGREKKRGRSCNEKVSDQNRDS